MANIYKTPGVFIEEIVKFPPSIAAVETAIPAFIGYTEKATEKIEGDLIKVPTKITAIEDYNRLFGRAEAETGFTVQITDQIDAASGQLLRQVQVIEPDAADKSPFLMRYSIEMYFANGGGPCYIISVGTYTQSDGSPTDISLIDLGNNATGIGGLDLLETEDEPTLIVFPDAQDLNNGDFYGLYQAALNQCNKLQDRFAIMDTKGDTATAPTLLRDKIGTNYLKYGAVYYPFIETILDYRVDRSEVRIQHTLDSIFDLLPDAVTEITDSLNTVTPIESDIETLMGTNTVPAPVSAVTASGLSKEERGTGMTQVRDAANTLITDLGNIQTEIDAINTSIQPVVAVFSDPDIQNALNAINSVSLTPIIVNLPSIVEDAELIIADQGTTPPYDNFTGTQMIEVANNLRAEIDIFYPFVTALVDTHIPALIAAINGNNPTTAITNLNTQLDDAQSARDSILLLSPTDKGEAADVAAQIEALNTAINEISAIAANVAQIPALNASFPSTENLIQQLTALYAIFDGTPSQADYEAKYTSLVLLLEEVFVTLVNIQNGVNYLNLSLIEPTNGTRLPDIRNVDNESYNIVLQELGLIGVKLPPSSIIAGIYAKVDRDRGVWKAPANVSLSSVIQPTVKITNDIQDGLNVDAVSGKSINALRAFAGKGTMVWGARTLAGNDNEWRYVSVRRFFNFVEESVKKATEQFVFEPNDANTWTRVRAMIENFLILQWRAGALTGAKPKDAFYVRVGLGETMTAQDVLEGSMIVEIGMAVVRPAEFIILRFSHKMQES
ncbi:MAG: phage tail sheath C-terminal domain-containing protein [Bacteroidota bacterium]